MHYFFKFIFKSYLAEKLLQEILIYIFGFMIRAKIMLFHWKLCGKPSRGNANARFILHKKEHKLAFLWNFTHVQIHIKVAKPMTKRLFQKIQWLGWIASGCAFQVSVFQHRPVWAHLAQWLCREPCNETDSVRNGWWGAVLLSWLNYCKSKVENPGIL